MISLSQSLIISNYKKPVSTGMLNENFRDCNNHEAQPNSVVELQEMVRNDEVFACLQVFTLYCYLVRTLKNTTIQSK